MVPTRLPHPTTKKKGCTPFSFLLKVQIKKHYASMRSVTTFWDQLKSCLENTAIDS